MHFSIFKEWSGFSGASYHSNLTNISNDKPLPALAPLAPLTQQKTWSSGGQRLCFLHLRREAQIRTHPQVVTVIMCLEQWGDPVCRPFHLLGPSCSSLVPESVLTPSCQDHTGNTSPASPLYLQGIQLSRGRQTHKELQAKVLSVMNRALWK